MLNRNTTRAGLIGLGIGFFGLLGEMPTEVPEVDKRAVLYPPLDVPESLDRLRIPDGILPRTTEAFGGRTSTEGVGEEWRSPWYDEPFPSSELDLGLDRNGVVTSEGGTDFPDKRKERKDQAESDSPKRPPITSVDPIERKVTVEVKSSKEGAGEEGIGGDLNDLFGDILGVEATPNPDEPEVSSQEAPVKHSPVKVVQHRTKGSGLEATSEVSKPREVKDTTPEGPPVADDLLKANPDYQHPFLQSLLSVLSNEPRLKAAYLQIKIEEAKMKQSRGALLPSVDLIGTVETKHERSRSSFQDSTHPAELGLVMTQPIFHRDSMLNYRSSKVKKEEVLYQTEEQRQEVIEDLCARYLDIHRFKVLADYSRNNAGLSDQHYRSTKIRFERGELRKTDVHQAVVRHKTALAVKEESYSQVEIARRRLEELTREPAPEDVPFFNLDITPQYLKSVQAQGGTRLRPDLKVLEQQVEQERLQGEVARSRHLPKLDLTLEQSRSWVDDAGTTPNPLDETRVALDLQWNLLNGTSSFYEVSERDLREEQLRLKLLFQKREAERLISESIYKVGITQKLVDNYGEAVKAADKALRGIQEEFLVGTRTSLDAFDAQNELFISQTRWINAKVDHLLAEVALLRASGHLRFEILASILADEEDDDAR